MTPTTAPPRRTPTRPRTVRITDDQWVEITHVAADLETTVSQLVRDHFTATIRRHNSQDTTP